MEIAGVVLLFTLYLQHIPKIPKDKMWYTVIVMLCAMLLVCGLTAEVKALIQLIVQKFKP